MGTTGSSFQLYMQNAECKINKPALLIEACKLIDQMEIGQQQQDVQGDLYEYLLGHSNRRAQRPVPHPAPHHPHDGADDRPPAQRAHRRPGRRHLRLSGQCLPVHPRNAHSPEILTYDEQGWPHNLIGDQLQEDEQKALKRPEALRGFDNDSGMTMLRIGSMNLMLHGIESSQFFYKDTLSKGFDQEHEYDVILMNPPFKGAVDKNDLHDTLPAGRHHQE